MLTRTFDLLVVKRKLLLKKGATLVTTEGAITIDGSVGTGTATAGVLKLTTPETTVVDADQLGRIDFSAPLEASGTDAVLVGASIWAEADDTFSATVNDTDLVFATGLSAAATEKMRLSSTGELTVTSAAASAFAVGLTGATNPAFSVDSSTGSQTAGLKITGATAAGTVAAAVISSGAAANLTINAKGTGTIGIGTVSTGAITLGAATGVTGAATITSAGASSLAVGLAGATNPAFVVDSSTGSQAAGLKITGAVAAGTVAAAVISSGADANLTINAKGTGTIGIGSVSTGAVTVTPAMTASGIVTFKTAHSGLIHGCGASGANHALGATGDNALEYYFDSTHTTGDMRGMYLRLYFSGAGGSGEAARIFGTINNVSVATGGTVNGAHISLGTAGASAAVSGAANALRATFGIAAATTALNGTCAVIQVDTDFTNGMNMPSNFAFLRFTNSGTSATVPQALLRIPNVAAVANGLFCAHTTQVMTHSIRIVSEDGTEYHIMCTNTATNRTES